jgi:hypothetical protein
MTDDEKRRADMSAVFGNMADTVVTEADRDRAIVGGALIRAGVEQAAQGPASKARYASKRRATTSAAICELHSACAAPK